MLFWFMQFVYGSGFYYKPDSSPTISFMLLSKAVKNTNDILLVSKQIRSQYFNNCKRRLYN